METNETFSELINKLGSDELNVNINEIKTEEPALCRLEENNVVTLNTLSTEELGHIFDAGGTLDDQPNLQASVGEHQVITATKSKPSNPPYVEPHIKVIEEPGDTRFRFIKEGRGTLPGINATKDTKTFPTIQIIGFNGPAKVLVSCIEASEPYRAHPHQLTGKACKEGVCIVTVSNCEAPIILQHLGIARATVKEVAGSLTMREKQKIDPFNQGFQHMNQAKTIKLHDIRLCFQAYLGTRETGFSVLTPVVSRLIRNKEPNSDLQIANYSDDNSPVEGGKKILLFCGKIKENDIEVHLEVPIKGGDKLILKGMFSTEDIHNRCGIAFTTPPYLNEHITEPVKVNLILYKPSDQTSSDSVDFWYVPNLMPPSKFPNSPLPSPGAVQTFKMPLKRPKEREEQQEESTGQFYVPRNRTKSEQSQDTSRKSRLGEPGSERKSSFTEQVMEQAKRDEMSRQSSKSSLSTSKSIEENDQVPNEINLIELANFNTAEILDLVNDANTDNMDNISMKLTSSLTISEEQEG